MHLANNWWDVSLDEQGRFIKLATQEASGWSSIPLASEGFQGVAWFCIRNTTSTPVAMKASGDGGFQGRLDDVDLNLQYTLEQDRMVITATATNRGRGAFAPQKLGLRVGLSNYMAKYPQWNGVYFPTMLRCERTHFVGYLMTPAGRILGLASPDPIASWSLVYNYGYGPKNAPFWGHRIISINLDLLDSAPLPLRHPQHLSGLEAGETRTWRIFLAPIAALSAVPKQLAALAQAPMFEINRTTLAPGEPFSLLVHSGELRAVQIRAPSNAIHPLDVTAEKTFTYLPTDGVGAYSLTAEDAAGHVSEATITVRKPWSWYLQQARLASFQFRQKASWCCESWYGLYSAYLAEVHFPDPELLRQTNERFDLLMRLMYDRDWQPVRHPQRIQNEAATIGILVAKYRATGNEKDLEAAAALADWLITHTQGDDGAYHRGITDPQGNDTTYRRGKTNYTCVAYPAKSLMELFDEEKRRPEKVWQERYERHYQSVQGAIDQLMRGGMGSLETEGEPTFEDGMISCAALQILDFALHQKEAATRERYAAKGRELLQAHDCLTQLAIPDSRQRGGTLRFWEAQFDVMMGNNMISSPHGWSAWRIYATYYAYLLDGNEDWLVQTMNALGSCVQLIDDRTGKLRWAFVVDPSVKTVQSSENFPGTSADTYNANQFNVRQGKFCDVSVGEQYVDMVSDWFTANSSDNDVHEIFKCLEEVALTSAFVLEHADGTLLAYNCTAVRDGGWIVIKPAEAVVKKVHVNLRGPSSLRVQWADAKATETNVNGGMTWIKKS